MQASNLGFVWTSPVGGGASRPRCRGCTLRGRPVHRRAPLRTPNRFWTPRLPTLCVQSTETDTKAEMTPSPAAVAAASSVHQRKTVVVFGASGRTGRQVLQAGVQHWGSRMRFRAVVRDAAALDDTLGALEAAGEPSPPVDVHAVGDYARMDEAAVAAALDGADAVLWVAGARGGVDDGFSPEMIDYRALQRMVQVANRQAPRPDGMPAANRLPLQVPQESAALVDFAQHGTLAAAAFHPVDDVVMGGRSRSAMEYDAAERAALFTGRVTTDGGGGFCQVRCEATTVVAGGRPDGYGEAPLRASPPNTVWDLGSYDGIVVVVRGDGRRYKVNLRTDDEPELVFQQELTTTMTTGRNAAYETHFLPFDQFVPTRRGQTVYGTGAAFYGLQLDAHHIRSIGLVVSKVEVGGGLSSDFVSGTFALRCRRIGAYRAVPPRLVVLSSAAVTRPLWSAEKRRAYPGIADVPIVQLNPRNILGYKLAGEDALRTEMAAVPERLGVPYAVVRAVGLNDGDDEQFPGAASGALVLQQGDTARGKIQRRALAAVMLSLLEEPAAFCKTFEVLQDPRQVEAGGMAGMRERLREQLRRMPVDVARALSG
eukprot:ctg_3596.g570